MKKILFLSALVLSISACAPVPQQVMRPLQYQHNIALHVPQKAYLYWHPGIQESSTAPNHASARDGILGAAMDAVIDSEMHKSNPSRYTFTYGKTQQVVFMTSLKDILEEQHVFTDVILTSDVRQASPDDVLIQVYFRNTKVLGAETNYRIVLDVDMSIDTENKSSFKRTYLIESKKTGFFSMKSFKEQQTDASQQLLIKVIAGIKQWHAQK